MGKNYAMKQARAQAGLSQQELADELGVSRQTISSLETGRYNPSIFLAHNIARFFGMTIEEALKVTNKKVVEFLGGLPQQKLHCSVLAEEAIQKAIEDYLSKKKD